MHPARRASRARRSRVWRRERAASAWLSSRIEPVSFFELERKTLDQIARKHAGRVEALQDDQNGFAIFTRGAEPLCDLVQIGAQITGFIHRFDQNLGNEALMRQKGRYRKLRFEMAFERDFRG